ncbi:hypothetical protein MO973_34965 [Paenibacillus sp. TRM 82003]|nr:hypothetical protein [Kineococcus sp. TRM81007]MCI2240654.1 hypothetical protein [Kineococcus sp. TRM81007]MCI3925423.1 hypothetical protein [Paenibacillus sp. TRM 82003]
MQHVHLRDGTGPGRIPRAHLLLARSPGAGRLNERDRTYLRLDLASGTRGTYGVTNAGFSDGTAVQAGELYDVSVWARSDATGGTPLTLALTGDDGRALSGQFRVQVRGDGYSQFAEDIGAMPLPVVPALLTGCGQNQATDDPELLQRHVQDTLDLIEFANGPATSTRGRVRAEMGHPEPFGLTHLGIGNEEDLPEEYAENFAVFRDAVAAASGSTARSRGVRPATRCRSSS